MAREYQVGYGKPPKATGSNPGNPVTRRDVRKGSANLASDLSAELGERITVREGGRARQISKQRALIKSLMAKALQGDVRATTALLALYARVISEPPDDDSGSVAEDELLILRRFGPRLLKSLARNDTER